MPKRLKLIVADSILIGVVHIPLTLYILFVRPEPVSWRMLNGAINGSIAASFLLCAFGLIGKKRETKWMLPVCFAVVVGFPGLPPTIQYLIDRYRGFQMSPEVIGYYNMWTICAIGSLVLIPATVYAVITSDRSREWLSNGKTA